MRLKRIEKYILSLNYKYIIIDFKITDIMFFIYSNVHVHFLFLYFIILYYIDIIFKTLFNRQ